MIYACKIYFQQPTTAALMEYATLSESGSHIVISKFLYFKYILHSQTI